MKPVNKLTRREFLKLSGMFVGAMMLPRPKGVFAAAAGQFPQAEKLGRICVGMEGAWFKLKTEPNVNAPEAGMVWRDDVLIWNREVVANQLDLNVYNQRWVETPGGYLQSSMIQPVKNIPNQPLSALPVNPDGSTGMWIEITVPLVDIKPLRSPAASYWIREVNKPRIYYSQVFWAYDVRQENGITEYLLTEKWGAEPDSYWVDASACRPINDDEITPIHPDVGDKLIRINMNYQTLSCLEGGREVYFCEVSSGGPSTPLGTTLIWRKMISTHMSAGGLIAYDTAGIGWTTLFHGEGSAIHAAFWHNNFGTALSHGCINCLPEDAKWIWRWTNPAVTYYPGELTVSDGGKNSTRVEVFY
ncbi:MAG TPA: L,D-transpeptidase [Anaerolineaceae bacterium]|jgi:hypothetical protein|nr:L,D-transpeptidase [Anaerolineaceae bacterium]NMD27214.1 L,D-transpeptidase [Chloroflexota bacterium]HOA21833.1 L,D-transpeptidase [Anaerolineaceae bacterium]HOG76890.1 L,D-transpeptidase [Anaerolineaceae bacterium]